MPILQSRMIALINAGTDFRHAHAELRRAILQQITQFRHQTITAEQALHNIELYATDSQSGLEHPMESGSILAVEEHHFKTHARDNLRAKRRAERRRRGEVAGSFVNQYQARQQQIFIQDPERPQAHLSPAAAGEDDEDEGPPPNVGWDPTDPENSLDEGGDLAGQLFGHQQAGQKQEENVRPDGTTSLIKSSITSERAAELDLEVDVINSPSPHKSDLGPDGLVRCECHFVGSGAEWRAHLPPAGNTAEQRGGRGEGMEN